jgi:hypothetical protein
MPTKSGSGMDFISSREPKGETITRKKTTSQLLSERSTEHIEQLRYFAALRKEKKTQRQNYNSLQNRLSQNSNGKKYGQPKHIMKSY